MNNLFLKIYDFFQRHKVLRVLLPVVAVLLLAASALTLNYKEDITDFLPLDDNYRIMAGLDKLNVMGLPLLVGISRKSMIFRLLGGTPETSLNGTTVLNTLALQAGASILRVHDVAECVEAVKMVGRMHHNNN